MINPILRISALRYKYLPQILFIYSIVIDNINGYFQDSIDLHLPIGIIFRGSVLVLLFMPVIRKGRSWLKWSYFFITLIYILCASIWFLFSSDFHIGAEFDYFFKLQYFFMVILFFYTFKKEFDISSILKTVFYAGFYIGTLNIFCFLTGIGVKSYGETFGFGTKAFYADGNSLGLYMILTLCLMIWYSFFTNKKKYFIMSFVATIGTLLIGSRAALIGSSFIWLSLLFYYCFFKDSYLQISNQTKFAVLTIGGGFIGIILYGLVLFITTFDSYTSEKFSTEEMASPRKNLIGMGKDVIESRTGLSYFIGDGMSGGTSNLGDAIPSMLIGKKTIEADNYDILLYFGYGFGGIIILFYILFYYIFFVHPYLKKQNSLTFTLLVCGTIWYGASCMAGHGFFNTALAPLFGVLTILSHVSFNNYDFKKTKQ